MTAEGSRREDGGHRPPLQKVVLGTRGSDLARQQTRLVQAALNRTAPAVRIETQIIRTSGDERAGISPPPVDRRAGRKGMFTREIERALLAGEIDVAVHSAKDLPSEMTAGLEIAAVLARANVDDVLIANRDCNLASIPAGAVIATGSVRRAHQLKLSKPNIETVDFRGNVPTRLRKLLASDWHGIVLARAGLERLGLEIKSGQLRFEDRTFFAQILPRNQFLPAGGQGIIALQIRSDDDRAKHLLATINHNETFPCLRAEREFLRLLNGDCDSPVGVLASLDSGLMRMSAQVFEQNGGKPRAADVEGTPTAPEELAARLMEKIDGR